MQARATRISERVCTVVLTLTVAVFLPAAIGGCNTVEGVGEDMSAAGGAIDEAAEDAN